MMIDIQVRKNEVVNNMYNPEGEAKIVSGGSQADHVCLPIINTPTQFSDHRLI